MNDLVICVGEYCILARFSHNFITLYKQKQCLLRFHSIQIFHGHDDIVARLFIRVTGLIFIKTYNHGCAKDVIVIFFVNDLDLCVPLVQ